MSGIAFGIALTALFASLSTLVLSIALVGMAAKERSELETKLNRLREDHARWLQQPVHIVVRLEQVDSIVRKAVQETLREWN